MLEDPVRNEFDESRRLPGARSTENGGRSTVRKGEDGLLRRVERVRFGCHGARAGTPKTLDRHGSNGSGKR
jgi:hypothetical protein